VFSINTFIYLFQRRHSSQAKFIIFSVFMGCCITVFASKHCWWFVLLLRLLY